ncbi:MAG: type VI secretion system protein TssL, long form [Paracoccus sp. (in: a-proteobacteria)]|uniref:type VI secretion system protein TssL, long form n=1 Tax=Paracoccus sp. TaxID=267 RepID=UPI0026DEC9A4|nr:type VI secretion system protein TssL, long form [Paracoccus sp. (in: a-proteobacteria)]MDO5622786.1 type VI secretion system protein TssL, long form [Paracoccus sp. (in: a-proteobacteria)]
MIGNLSPLGQAGAGIGAPPAGYAGQGGFDASRPASDSPFGGPNSYGAPGANTWLGTPAAPSSVGQGGYPSAYGGAAGIGQAAGGDRGFFPDFQPRPDARPARTVPRVALHDAMRVRELGAASSANPLLAAAAGLLILLGRLRTGMVELQVSPLMEHVTREIERFERNALAAGVSPHEALVAKYALSGTADDIVQNLPGGGERGSWQQYSMVARFFHKRDSGVGFFQEAEKAMQVPAQSYNLLELMLVCLSLGFEGQFRTMPNGGVELARIRNAIYESLRRVHQRPDEDISVMWAPVVQGRGRRFGAIPLPAVLGIAGVAVLAVFAMLATLINRDGAAAAEALRGLHQGVPVLQIDRTETIPYVVADPQLERLRSAFAPEISEGQIAVEPKGDFIAIRVGELQLFDSGQVTVKDGFTALASRIAQVLNTEGGPVVIEGHTDNVPMSGRGRYKDNYQLSQARAAAVAGVLVPFLTDADRVQVEGRGEDDAIQDNATPEGRSANRRVEVMLAREGTYDAAPAADDIISEARN